MNPRFFWTISLLIIVLIIGNLWLRNADQTQQGQAGVSENQGSTGTAAIGGVFSLISTEGETVTSEDLKGQYNLIYFGFSNCPMICPQGLNNITQALTQLGQLSQLIQPVFITVDPERDTPEALASYMENFHPRFIALTGTKEATEEAKAAYHVYAQKVEEESLQGGYDVQHTSLIYVMGPDGNYVQHFAHDATGEQIATRLREILSQ